MKFVNVSIDVETTGLNYGLDVQPNSAIHEIVQISILQYDKNFKIVEEFDTLVKPIRVDDIDDTAMQINGISLEDLEDAPNPLIVKSAMMDFKENICPDGKLFPLGFNYDAFDKQFLLAFLGRDSYNELFHYKCKDVFQMFILMKEVGYFSDFEKDRLSYLCERFDIVHKAHDSIGDAYANIKVFEILTNFLRRR